jgi:hypothetical protein
MLNSWRDNLDCNIVAGLCLWQLPVVLAAALACEPVIAGDGLWVEHPEEVAFSVADMTQGAKDMGLTGAGFAATLSTMLQRAGLKARQTDFERDSDVLFLDIIVEDETFYASLGFWRMVSYRLPNGVVNSEFVTVWQDYSVGAHHEDPGKVRATVNSITERFIAKYQDVNKVGSPLRVASMP